MVGGQTEGRGQEMRGEGGLDGSKRGSSYFESHKGSHLHWGKLWIKECQPPSYLPSFYCDTSMSSSFKEQAGRNLAFILWDSHCLDQCVMTSLSSQVGRVCLRQRYENQDK